MLSRAGEAMRFVQAVGTPPDPPAAESLKSLLESAIQALGAADPGLRPRGSADRPGSLIRLPPGRVFILPDLHGRADLIADLLVTSPPRSGEDSPGPRIIELMEAGEASVLCLGDLLHTEGPEAAARWRHAARRAIGASREGFMGPEMEEEMGYSLSCLAAAAGLQALFPDRFFCLKGNHDNMCNRFDHGDLPFYKYANEGSMGADWFRERYGPELCEIMRAYELSLPLLAAGGDFCASHAEPAFPLRLEELIENPLQPSIAQALMWTRDGEAMEGSIAASMDSILGASSGRRKRLWVVGHTALHQTHLMRDDGLLQIHSRNRRQALVLWNGPGEEGGGGPGASGSPRSRGIFRIPPGGGWADFLPLL